MHIPFLHTKQRVRVVYALAFVFAASITTQMVPSFDGAAVTGTVLQRGDRVLSRDMALRRKRSYQQVLKVCNDRDGVVEGMTCPDVNDVSAVKAFLKDAPAVHPAAPAAQALRRADLSAEDRALLDRYTGRGVCPQTLRRIVPGFYELCLSLTVDTTTRSMESMTTVERRRARRLQQRLESGK